MMTGTAPRKRQFIKNAAILTAASLILRAAGMLFRIYISALIGAEGVGLYQLMLSVYTLASGFASSGIVVAVTRMTADRMVTGTPSEVRSVLRKCLAVSASMGIISTALLLIFAGPVGRDWISDPRSVSGVRIMAFALPFMSVSCCLRGYFTARRRVTAPTLAQITEQTVRIALAVLLLKTIFSDGIEQACCAIMLSDVISEGAGCLYIIAAYLIDRRRLTGECGTPRKSRRFHVPAISSGREIWQIAAPITASHYLTSLLRTVESILVPDCLAIAEGSRAHALELFGMVRGMALPLILFPSALLTAISALLTPEMSQAKALGDNEMAARSARRSIRLTAALSVPLAAVFLLWPSELGTLIYGEPQLGRILLILAPLLPLMYIESVSIGLLNGLGEQRASLIYCVIDSVVRIVLIALLGPRMGLNGYLTVMAVSNILTPALHLRRLMRTTAVRPDFSRWLFRPLLSSAAGFVAGRLADSALISAGANDLTRVCVGTSAVLLTCAAFAWGLEDESTPVLPFAARGSSSGISSLLRKTA